MDIRKNSRLLKVAAETAPSFGFFLTLVMSLLEIDTNELAERLKVTRQYIYMCQNNLSIPDTKACFNLATGLNIDPFLLNRVASDHKMRKLIQEKKEVWQENMLSQ